MIAIYKEFILIADTLVLVLNLPTKPIQAIYQQNHWTDDNNNNINNMNLLNIQYSEMENNVVCLYSFSRMDIYIYFYI